MTVFACIRWYLLQRLWKIAGGLCVCGWLLSCSIFAIAQEPAVSPPALATTLAPTRLPIPTAEQIQATRQIIEQVFGKELAAARTPETRQKAAATLLSKAKEAIAADDPAGNYALLLLARELALQAGDLRLALLCVDQLANDYEVDSLAEKLQTLRQQLPPAKSLVRTEQIVDAVPALLNQAVTSEQFLVALELLDLGETAAKKSKLTAHVKALAARRGELKSLQQLWLDARTAQKKLQTQPDDAAAHRTVGIYLCQVRSDWLQGLPHLVQGNDVTIQKLAQQELAEPATATAQVEVGDGWWNYGETLTGHQHRQVLLHAADWYQIAQPNLSGLMLARIEHRLEAAAELRDATTAQASDLVGGIPLVSLIPVNLQAQLFESSAAVPAPPQRALGGQPCKTWLFHHPGEKATAIALYDLRQHRSQWFESQVGIADGAKDLKTQLVFEVWGNGKLLWNSKPIGQTGQVENCRVKLNTVTRLELRVRCPGSSRFAWATWGNPQLIP